MKYIIAMAAMLLCSAVFAEDTHFDYDRAADFSGYKTYQWLDRGPVVPGDQLLDQTSGAPWTNNSQLRVCSASRPAAVCG
jgi:hypothetical protein